MPQVRRAECALAVSDNDPEPCGRMLAIPFGVPAVTGATDNDLRCTARFRSAKVECRDAGNEARTLDA